MAVPSRTATRGHHDDSRRNRLQLGGDGGAENGGGLDDFLPDVVRFPDALPWFSPRVQGRIQGGTPQAEGISGGVWNQAVFHSE